MRQIMCLLLAKSSLCPDAFDDPQAFAQGSFQDFGVAPTHSSSPDAHLAHEPLVDRKRRLHLSHISILPYRGGIRLVIRVGPTTEVGEICGSRDAGPL
jgi:hypothetical protein